MNDWINNFLGLNGCGPSQVQNARMNMLGGGGMATCDKNTFMTINTTVTKVVENEENPD